MIARKEQFLSTAAQPGGRGCAPELGLLIILICP
jgi:hypothetical protein